MKDRTLCFLLQESPHTEVLLGLKKIGFGRGKYAGFGGGVEVGETVELATIRELAEETGINVAESDLQRVAHLTFLFPAKPEWRQTVHVFLTTKWDGKPVESDEMRPAWYRIEELPFDQMWSDAVYWLRLILTGKRIKAHFMFKDDNETIDQSAIAEWSIDVYHTTHPISDLNSILYS